MAGLRYLLAVLALAAAASGQCGDVARWSAHIDEASRRFGIPQEWIGRVMSAESDGRPQAVSHAGAMGLMQLMPGTWAEMRHRMALGTDPFEPRDNILAGTFYLKLMHDRFGYPGLFAAYNAGPERYAAYLAGRRSLPLETQLYLADIAPSAEIAQSGTAQLPVPAEVQSRRGGAIFFPLSGDAGGK